MSKIEIYEQISDYIDGNMTDNELKDFEIIMSKDENLQKEVQEIKDLIQNIKNVDNLSLPDDFNIKLDDAIKHQKSTDFNIFKLFDSPVLVTVGSIAAAILLVVTATIFFSESQPLTIIDDENQIALEEEEGNIEEVEISTQDGLALLGWYHEKDIRKNKTILFFHGNAGSLENRIHKLNHFRDMSVNFLIVAWRGFSGNEGKPSEIGLYEDGESAIRWLMKKGVDTWTIRKLFP